MKSRIIYAVGEGNLNASFFDYFFDIHGDQHTARNLNWDLSPLKNAADAFTDS